MDFFYMGTCVYLIASIISTESLTFTTENFHDGKWIIKHGATGVLICRNNPYTGKMSLIYEKQRVAECSQNSCTTYFTDNGAFKITFDIKNGELHWNINPITSKYDGKLFKCSDGTETLRLSPIVQESLTFTTENIHGGKWIIKNGETDTLICRSNPYKGKMYLIYDKQRVAECSQNSCETYFTDNGSFEITFDIKNGEIQWKINPITSKYEGKLFKCSDGTKTLWLSPIVQESLTFTTENIHGGKWIIKNGATDTLICRSNPYIGKLYLIYDKQRVAECSQNSCETYFTDYGSFEITFDIKNGEIQWKINPVTMKYDDMLFRCSDGTKTLRLSPIVQESLKFSTENFSDDDKWITTGGTTVSLTFTTENDGEWIFTNGATDTLICRSNPYTGKMYLMYEKKLVADCSQNSCKTYFTDYGSFKILSNIMNGILKWKISPITTKYNGKEFQCSNGLKSLRFSPIIVEHVKRPNFEHVKDTGNFFSRNVMHICVLVLVIALSIFAIRSHCRAGTKIMKKDITFVKIIGKGEFGEVWKGVWHRSGKDKIVALKTFKKVEREQVGVQIEVEIMQGMDHENIVQFYGTCMHDDNTFIVMELVEKGNLLEYLIDERGNLETPQFVDIAIQIVKGLIYLESQKIIHRDLAARNILVSSFREWKTIKTVKIADFGLARRLPNANSEYIPMQGELTPFNGWTAPEALEHNIFTFKSDVWSFGILFMEMVMFGERPYAGLENKDILTYLKQSPDNRMKCPKHCHPELYQIMQMCWKFDRVERPTFQKLKKDFIRLHNLKL